MSGTAVVLLFTRSANVALLRPKLTLVPRLVYYPYDGVCTTGPKKGPEIRDPPSGTRKPVHINGKRGNPRGANRIPFLEGRENASVVARVRAIVDTVDAFAA